MSKQYQWLLTAWLLFSGAAVQAQPGWIINPAQYQYNMTMVAQIRIAGVPNHQMNNHLAAFWHGQIRGYATPVAINGQAYYFMTLYSNVFQGDTLTFRAFIGADQKVYESNYILLFKHQKILGSIPAPQQIDLFLSVHPVIYSPPNADYLENTCGDILDVQSTDNMNSESDGLTYSIPGGADAAKFSINPLSGVLQWVAGFSPDFAAPADANGDNRYEVRVRVTDASNLYNEQNITVRVFKSTPLPPLNCPPNRIATTSDDGLGNCSTTVSGLAVQTTVPCAWYNLSYQLTGATTGNGTGMVPTGQLFGKGLTSILYSRSGGNPSQCSFTVTVNDSELPFIACPANTSVAVGTACTATLTNYIGATTATDNCTANPAKTQFPAAGTVMNLGPQTVTMSATDAAGGSRSCTFTVTVNDQSPPGIVCPVNTTVAVNATCTVSLANYIGLASATDNCTISPTKTQFPVAGTVINPGAQIVTITATDDAGYSANCDFTVFVIDQIPPAISCPANTTAAVGANCMGALASYLPAATATDNCTASPLKTQFPAIGTLVNIGTQTILIKATDDAGWSASCTFTVAMTDQSPPDLICPANTTVAVGANCTASLSSYIDATTATDNCTANPVKMQSPVPGTTLNPGNQTVTMTATDDVGLPATCIFTVSVTDQTPPGINCPANVTVAADADCKALLANYTGLATATDNCTASPNKTQSPVAGTIINLGTQILTMMATDGAGSTGTCTFAVSVTDQAPPTIICPVNTTVAAGATCTASLADYRAFATASDNCTVSPGKVQIPMPGTNLNLGSQTVTLTATDAVGGSANCTFSVAVTDQSAPTVVCKNATVNLDATGTGSITTASVFQSGADNCGTVNLVSALPNTFTCNNLGANTVTLMVNDGYGNSATCIALISVVDQIAPTAICKNITVILDAAGQVSLPPAQVNNGSFDNCGIVTMLLSQTTFSCAHLGTNPVIFTAVDAGSNKNSCVATVTVLDATPPVALCKNNTVALGAAGSITVLPAQVNNGSNDNCSFTLTLTPSLFTCSNLGSNTVTLKATDAGGNTATCTAVVLVKDQTAPTAICKNINVFLDNNGHATITAGQVNNGSSDNCGIAVMTINNNQFDCGQIGGSMVPITLTLKDASNNSSTCLAMVTVKDMIAPTAVCQNVTVKLNAQGTVTISPATLAANSNDNCSVWSYSPTAKVYTTANLGVNNLTITVKDYSGNAATCVSQVTVQPYNNQNLSSSPNDGNGSWAEQQHLRVYPNPTGGELTVAFQLPQDLPVQLRLFDLTGKLVLGRDVFGLEGENTLPLSLGDLPAGSYLLDLQSAEQREQKLLTIQH